jgi:antitoxin CptB
MSHAGDDPSSAMIRRRVHFRCWHRGTQESDLLLGSFADACLRTLDKDQLRRLESLLDCSDPDLFDWILGVTLPPSEHDHDVLHLLRVHWAPNLIGSNREADLTKSI